MQILIETNKNEYLPGEIILIRISLNLQKPVKARGIYAMLQCRGRIKKIEYQMIAPDEKRRMEELGLVVTSPVKRVEVFRDTESYKVEKKLAPAGEYNEQRWEVSFELPKNAAPTSYIMGHDDRVDAWKLKVRMDIPFAPDINAEKEIIVGGI